MTVPFMYNFRSLSNQFPTVFWGLNFPISLPRLSYFSWRKETYNFQILCMDVPPPSEKNREKRRLWIAVVNRVPVYICINYYFFVFFSDSWKGFDRPIRLYTLLEHVRSYSRGTQRLFSVKYLFGEANIA